MLVEITNRYFKTASNNMIVKVTNFFTVWSRPSLEYQLAVCVSSIYQSSSWSECVYNRVAQFKQVI